MPFSWLELIQSGYPTHCTGKTGEMAKNIPCQGKHREFGNFTKTQGMWFAQVVNSLILKVKNNSLFALKISKFLLKLDKSAKSFFCVIVTNHVNWHRKKLGSDRKNTGNLKMQFEWVPCTMYPGN